MKRTLIVAVIAGVFAFPTAVRHPVVASPLTAGVPAGTAAAESKAEATSDSVPCMSRNGSLLAAGAGCCQRHGGVCGCRDGTPKCCDGTIGDGCSCRADSPLPTTDFAEAL
jgi:hypothetical protein